jgi:arylsulfatase A-like enzyme
VIISVDTLRADHLTPYGYDRETSPHIAKLARDSVLYEQAYAAHTNTAPSHASMLTGVYPGTHGIRQNGMKLLSTVPTLAEILSDGGYATGAFVSGWTLTPHTGLDRGFDVYDARFTRSRRPGAESWQIAERWLKKTAKTGKPFFMFFHMFEPHFAYEPPDEYALRFLPGQTALTVPLDVGLPGLMSKRRLSARAVTEYTARYDGEIAVADEIVGKIVRRLKRLALLDNTLIVFTSDHGETLFERAWIADHGGRAYDEQAHVPMIVRFPHAEYRRKRVSAQVHHIDILPTVLDVTQRAAPPGLPGRSLLGVVRNRRQRSDITRPVFTHARPEPERVPEITASLVKTGIITAVRLPPFKLIEYPMASGGYFQQLFNIEVDPGETKNVAAANPEQVTALHAHLEAFRKLTGTGDTATPVPTLTPEVHEQLKSLGYVQ